MAIRCVYTDLDGTLLGRVDTGEANAFLAEHGHGALRLVDNGVISPKETLQDLPGPPHAYHLIPREASKAAAVARQMQARQTSRSPGGRWGRASTRRWCARGGRRGARPSPFQEGSNGRSTVCACF